eukprot:scaffold13818_cov56-Phaeocystis_antarctica.AAC.2
MEVSVWGSLLPRVSRIPFSASWHSGSAAERSPLSSSSAPRSLMESSRRAPRLQRLAEQRLRLVELALGEQLQREPTQGGACVLATRALGLEPCTQKLEAQRIAVLVHALAAAVGRVLPRARAPPLLKAVCVDPLGGAAAGARLHERAVVIVPPAQPARLLLHYHTGCERTRPPKKTWSSRSAPSGALPAGR